MTAAILCKLVTAWFVALLAVIAPASAHHGADYGATVHAGHWRIEVQCMSRPAHGGWRYVCESRAAR